MTLVLAVDLELGLVLGQARTVALGLVTCRAPGSSFQDSLSSLPITTLIFPMDQQCNIGAFDIVLNAPSDPA